MKMCFLTVVALLSVLSVAKGQLTEQQVRNVDSSYVKNYLQWGNFHTENSHPVVGGENIITWDHGSGLYTGIAGYFVGWSNTGRVNESIANMFNAHPGQSYRVFNLNEMQETQSYEDSLFAWLSGIGIPVGMQKNTQANFSLTPNPVEKDALLHLNAEVHEAWLLSIYDVSGRLFYNTAGRFEGNGLTIHLPFASYPVGMYYITLKSNTITFRTKVLKK